jgi:hypothetical protein
MDINIKVTESDIERAHRKEQGIESSILEETEIFEIDGLKSSLMGMLPGMVDGIRRYFSKI